MTPQDEIPLITLTKKEKESLLGRFDEKNARLLGIGVWEIQIPCILCELYNERGRCYSCPCKNEGERGSCREIMKQLGVYDALVSATTRVSWFNAYNAEARAALHKVREYIESCPTEENP